MAHTANNDEEVRAKVRERYGQTAVRVLNENEPGASGCCGSSCCSAKSDPITSNLYNSTELGEIPVAAALASMGCGNPTALAELKEGETVLDLGSGGGIDVLLSARRVGPTGFAYGLDMTDERLARSKRGSIGAYWRRPASATSTSRSRASTTSSRSRRMPSARGTRRRSPA